MDAAIKKVKIITDKYAAGNIRMTFHINLDGTVQARITITKGQMKVALKDA